VVHFEEGPTTREMTMRPKQPEAPSITRQAMRPSIARQAIAKQSGKRG